MLDIDKFKKDFSEKITKIGSQELDYANNIINISGSRLDKPNNGSEEKVLLSLEALQEINIIAYTLHSLDKKGITSANYGLKVKQFQNLREKLFDEFGVHIDLGSSYIGQLAPFSNPADLYEKIDVILTQHNLNTEQKKYFYMEFFNRERIPKQKKVIETIEHQNNINFMKENNLMIYPEMSGLFTILSEDEQAAILRSDPDYNYDEAYYNLLEKYKIEKLPESLLEHLSNIELHRFDYMDEKQAEDEKRFDETLRFHNFLSYPACLYDEAEFLNQTLDTDKYVSDIFEDQNK